MTLLQLRKAVRHARNAVGIAEIQHGHHSPERIAAIDVLTAARAELDARNLAEYRRNHPKPVSK